MYMWRLRHRTGTEPDGSTLLHAACFCGGATRKGWLASHRLPPKAVKGKLAAARYLIGLGLSPDAPNHAGWTARDAVTRAVANAPKKGEKGAPSAAYRTIAKGLPPAAAASGAPPPAAFVIVDAVPVEAEAPGGGGPSHPLANVAPL